MASKIEYPNFLGQIIQGRKARAMGQQNQQEMEDRSAQKNILAQQQAEKTEDRNYLMQQRQQEQQKLQQAADEKEDKDRYTLFKHIPLDAPDEQFLQEFDKGFAWQTGENPTNDPEELAERQRIMSMSLQEKRMIVQQGRNHYGIDTNPTKPNIVDWGYGQKKNIDTGEIIPIPTAPGRNTTTRVRPDGSIEIIEGTGEQGKATKFSEVQSKSGGFATRVEAANNIINELEDSKAFNPASITGSMASGTPFIGNILSSEERQVYNQSKLDFVTAVLRLESGAAINKDEFKKEEKKYFPQPGDGPKVIANKRAARERQFRILKGASGGAYDAINPPKEKSKETNKYTIDSAKSASIQDLEKALEAL